MGKRAATESKKPKASKRVKHVDEAQLEQQKARGSLWRKRRDRARARELTPFCVRAARAEDDREDQGASRASLNLVIVARESRGRTCSVPLSPAQDSLADTDEKLEEYSDYI